MNPISVLKTIDEMSEVEVFNYSRYWMSGSEARQIVDYFKGPFQEISEFIVFSSDMPKKLQIVEDKYNR
jgi:hypothetical protein